MKRITIACVTLLLCVFLAACEESPEASSAGDPGEAASSSQSVPQTEAPREEADSPVYDEEEIRAQFERAVESCADVIDSFEINIDEGAYPMPTLEEYRQISDSIGALGFPVYYYDLDMPNYEKVVAFCEDVQEGKDAQIVIYSLHNTGIYGYVVISRGGELYGAMAVYGFPDYFSQGEASEVVFDVPFYPVADLRLTENGYLVYRQPEYEGRSEMFQEFRVLPLGEENRELGRKYLEAFGYASGSLLAENWDKSDFSALDLPGVFHSLYYSRNGEFPSQYGVEWPDDGEAILEVPAAVLEEILQSGLPITTEQLREAIPYDEERDLYRYHVVFQGSYVVPEVTAAEENADGLLTMTVEAPFDPFDDDVLVNLLTVVDNPDGSARYLSNAIVTPRK